MVVSSLSSDVLSYSSNTTSGSVSFQGLGNGTDFGEIVDATIEAESYELEQYEADLEEAEYAVELLTALDEELLALSATLQEMDEVSEFYSYKESVSGDEITASAGTGAEEGSYNVVVNQLAKKDVWIAESYDIASTDTEVCSTTSTITLSYAGEEISMDVAAGTTAQELVDMINSNSDFDDKITASLIYDGSNYHLKFTGEDTGATNVVGIVDLSALDSVTAADFTNTQTAQNAQLKIDGYPSAADEWLERDSNTVDDLIDNMTLTLNDTTDADGLTIGVTYDTDAMIETIESFVTEVNQIIYDIQDLTGQLDDGEDDEDEFYLKDSSLDLLYSQLKNILSSQANGFSYYNSDTGAGDLFSSLSTVGLYTDSTEGSDTFGQLQIDYDELEEALSEDPEAVAELFAASGEASTDSSSLDVISSISGLTGSGEYAVEYTVSGGVITAASIDGVDLLISGNTLLAQRDSDANGLYLEVKDLTDGTYSSTVTVKQGKIGELADLCETVTDVETGSVPLLISSYENLTTKLENEIYDEEERLDALETELTRKYAALDETLSYYTNLESQLSISLAQLE